MDPADSFLADAYQIAGVFGEGAYVSFHVREPVSKASVSKASDANASDNNASDAKKSGSDGASASKESASHEQL